MPSLADLARRGAIVVLAQMARRGAISAAEFTEASTLTFDRAKKLREDLAEMGLIQVSLIRQVGAVRDYVISLTPAGLAVGTKFAEADDLLRRASAGELTEGVSEPAPTEDAQAATRAKIRRIADAAQNSRATSGDDDLRSS